jgi:hypothetical protein
MIKSIQGNAALKYARVVCLSDFHFDTTQKYIRAQIINEILRLNNAEEVFVLVEGVEAGHEANDWVYDKLVGNDLINYEHVAFGWDNMRLNRLGINLIKDVQNLHADGKKIELKHIALSKKRWEILKDTNTSPKKIFEMVDSLENEMNDLLIQLQSISTSTTLIFDKIKEVANERSKYLHYSINKILQKSPNSIVFAIGGADHFNGISTVISEISHCILNIKETRVVVDFGQAMNEVYGIY